MSPGWTALRAALRALRDDGIALPLWWRDDDATRPTAALDRLEKLGRDLGITVHIAVIPEPATEELAAHVAGQETLVPLVHGWRHANTAAEGAKKSEFGRTRAAGQMELLQARDRMAALFGDRVLPVFVPPWNRLDPSFLPVLSESGYRGVSTYTPRRAALAAPGLVQINTHIDPIDWRGTRDLIDPESLLAQIVGLLQDRRTSAADSSEPLGLLTHHLVHTPAIWDFCARLMQELLEGSAQPAALAPRLESPYEST